MVPRRESFVFFLGFAFSGPPAFSCGLGLSRFLPALGFLSFPFLAGFVCRCSASLPPLSLCGNSKGKKLPCLTRSLVTRGRDTPPNRQVSFVGLACLVVQPPGRRLRTRPWCVFSCGPRFVSRRRGLHWEHRLAEPPPRLPPSLWTRGPREEPLLALFRRLVTRPFRRAGGPLSLTLFCFGRVFWAWRRAAWVPVRP